MLSSRAVYRKAYEEHLEYLNYAEAIKIYAIELKSINKLQPPGLIDLLDMVILLAKTYQQAPKKDVLASIKTNFTNTILILLPKLPIDKQLEFYKTVCLFCLDLDKQITNSTFAYFANAIHLAEQVNQQDVLITKELEKFKIQARFSAMRPLIDYKLDKQNTIETYNVWQEIRPCLESAMALDIDSASSLFKSLENKLNLYVAAFLSGSNDTQLLQLKLNKLLEDTKSLLAYNYEPYQRIARSWLHYIISKTELEGIREAWENEKFKEKIYPKGQDLINGDFSLAKQYREELKTLRKEFELNIKQPIFKTQANYTTQVIHLLNKLAKDVASSLGEAPCTYSWIGIGSVSKGLLSPYSDLDCAILIENAEYRNHPYFTSFILSLDAVLKSLAEPWEFSAREEASCVGLRIDGGDLELIQAKKMPFIATPLELANWVIEVGRAMIETEQDDINYANQTLAFSLLSPCLLYSRHNNNLFSTYQEQLYKNLSGICSTTGKLVHETIAINFWHNLITDDLNKSNLNIQQNSIDLKHDCINPLIHLCTMAGLYYLISTKGILEANIDTILTNLEKKQCWHESYVKEIKEALEFLYKTRAELHLTSSKCYDTIELQNIPKWQAFKLASLTPWQGLVKLKYIFNEEENYHPLFLYARLIKEGLASKQKLTFDLELESLAYLPSSDLYNTYLLLPNEYRMYVIQGLQAIDAPIAVLEYYLNLPNHLGISLNKEKNLLAWQKTLLRLTEEYQPRQKAAYITNNRVMLEWVVIEDGVAKKISRLFPQSYRANGKSAAYFKNGKFNIAQLKQNNLIIQEGKSQVLKLIQNNSLVAYAKIYPEAPGVQLQADTLSQRLSGTNFHSTLAKVIPLSNPQQSFPLLFSQVVAETIQEHLNQDKDLTEIETQLDPFYFSLKLLETLVISPEDDKPDNVGLYRLANNKYRLISFDADHAFYPAMMERIGLTGKERKVQLKSIALCFAQMQNTIHPDAKSLFLSFKPYDLLQDFLLELDANYQQQLFTPAEIQKFLKDKYWLANAFEVGTVAKLYEQILRIQAALKDEAIISHLDLLARIEPLASDYYLKLYQHTSPRERWEALQPDTEYKLVVNQSGHIVCQSGLTATARAKRSITVAKERKDKAEAYNPSLALAELQGIHNQYQQINNLINQLNQGNSEDFIVSYPFIQEQVLKRLDFSQIDYNECQPSFFYSEHLKTFRQDKLKNAIKELKNLYELHFINYALLNYTDLISILANHPELRVLNLSGCKNIVDYWRSMGWALSYVPHLEYLNLSDTNINTLTSNVPFYNLSLPKLRRLILHNCHHLSNLIINAPNLEYLQIKGCNLLPMQAIETLAQTYPKLIRLELINNLSFNLKGLTQITWPELTQLGLTVSQDNLPEISNYLPMARQCLPKLNQINLQKYGIGIKTLSGHKGEVCCLAVLANGNLASSYLDNTIKIWDTVSYTCSATLTGHQRSVYCLAELVNGNLASGSADGVIKIWDTVSYTCIATLTGHQRDVSCLAELANGNLANGSNDNTIKIWDTGYTCIATLTGHKYAVLCLAALANGNLASGSSDNTIKIWDTANHTCITTLTGHQGEVTCLAALANGNLASGSWDKTIKIWDTVSYTCIATLTGHQGPVLYLAVLANGNLASGSYDNTIKIWDTSYTCITTLTEHQSLVLCLAALANGMLASSSYDKTIKIWDFSSLNLEFGLWQELELIELDDLSLSWHTANIAASNSLKACAEFLGDAKLLNTEQIEFNTKESLGRFLLTMLGGELTSSGRLKLNLNLANLRSLSIKNSNIVEEITGNFAQLEIFDVDNHIVIIHNNLTTTYADELQDSIIGDNATANDTIRTLTLNAANFVQKTNKSKHARDLEKNLEQDFFEIELPEDGNCALHGLGISRNKAIEQLIKHGKEDITIRKKLLQDINELINEAESVASNIKGVTTTEIYIVLKRKKDLALFTLNQKMNFLNNRFELNGNDSKNDLPGFLDLLGEFSPEYLELQKLEQEKSLAEQAILDYLMMPDIYENFIRSSYEKPKVDGSWQWLSFAVMEVLANINKMNLVIKKLSTDNTYDSMYEWIINDGPVRTLLYTLAGTKGGYNGNNLNHFNVLSTVPDGLCDPVNIASSDKITAIQRENNFNLFNQEQLVSKSKNLIWSQVQENISIDSNSQNSCIDSVFDNLVDADFFNSFEDDFDESDMVVTTKCRSKFQ
jgi:WD40 repeat protein